jgi:hypothetical protein
MGVVSTQGINFQLVAGENQVILDLFKDEQIFLSDNITGLFDLGILPADFTRQLTLPGTKKNNAFFEHVYDIAVTNPDTFATNKKVPCYLDFGGIYLAQGYLQLNKVSVIANKFIDSYTVSLYGAISSFAREVNRSYLTDMTASLSQFDHDLTLENITGSWNGTLFSGSIVYPMAEYGQKIIYSASPGTFGIDDPSGSLFVQDYKPAIRIKEVWNAIFNEYGYTYTGDFWNQAFLNNIYLVCNNALRYPKVDSIDLETYGQFKIGPVSGSTDIQFNNSVTESFLPFYNVQTNPAGNIDTTNLEYSLEYDTKLRGFVNLAFEVSGSGGSTAVPQFELVVKDLSDNIVGGAPLIQVNNFMLEVRASDISQGLAVAQNKYTVLSEFNTEIIPSGSYKFFLEVNPFGSGTLNTFVAPDGDLKSYIQVTKVGNVGEGETINIGQNMPFGTKGIKKIDFITGIQRKFNLVIYPSKTVRNQFIVESFNEWYKEGVQWDFNQYIDLDKPIDVTPANNLAVNELNFGDVLDNDYVSQQFSKEANREFGKTYYVDTENFFSQGNFEVKTSFASSPIVYLQNTGVSGSQAQQNLFIYVDDFYWTGETSFCLGTGYLGSRNRTYAVLVDAFGTPVINYGADIFVLVEYTISGCGGSFTYLGITIPYGSDTGFVEYTSLAYVDCGFGCEPESTTVDCVSNVSQYSVYASSPIAAC